jgi:hypothetical protein
MLFVSPVLAFMNVCSNRMLIRQDQRHGSEPGLAFILLFYKVFKEGNQS